MQLNHHSNLVRECGVQMLRESGVNEDVEFDVPAEFVEAEGGAQSFLDFLSKAAEAEVEGTPPGDEERRAATDDASAWQQQAAAGSEQVLPAPAGMLAFICCMLAPGHSGHVCSRSASLPQDQHRQLLPWLSVLLSLLSAIDRRPDQSERMRLPGTPELMDHVTACHVSLIRAAEEIWHFRLSALLQAAAGCLSDRVCGRPAGSRGGVRTGRRGS